MYIYIYIYIIPHNVRQSSGRYCTSHFNVQEHMQQKALQCMFHYHQSVPLQARRAQRVPGS